MGKKKDKKKYMSEEVNERRILMINTLVGVNKRLKSFSVIMSDSTYGVNTQSLQRAILHLDNALVKLHVAEYDEDVYEVLRVDELTELLDKNGGRGI